MPIFLLIFYELLYYNFFTYIVYVHKEFSFKLAVESELGFGYNSYFFYYVWINPLMVSHKFD